MNKPKNMNVVDQSGLLAIATRLQRLTDHLRKDASLLYKEQGIDFEPRWFPVIYTLHHTSSMGVVDLAAEIGYAHPSIIVLLKELEKEHLVKSRKHPSDQRKRLVSLTDKGRHLVTRMQPVWQAMTEAIAELTNTQNNLLKAIHEVEANLHEKSFLSRTRKFMQK